MAPHTTLCRCITAALLVAVGACGCNALYLDLDTIPLRDDTSASDTGDVFPPRDSGATDADTRPSDTSDAGPDSGDIDSDDTGTGDTASGDTADSDADTDSRPSPEESCLAIASCGYLNCSELSDSCVDSATQHGDKPPRQTARDALSCARTHECDYIFSSSCFESNCGTHADACLDGTRTGNDLQCFEIFECQRRCDNDDGDCFTECEDSSSFIGGRRFGDLQSCIEEECRDVQPGLRDACLRSECSEEFTACMGCP